MPASQSEFESEPRPTTAPASCSNGAPRSWAPASLAALLLEALLGGFSPTGASTNAGWFALIVALMCIPFGGLLLSLGVAKWLRNRCISRHG